MAADETSPLDALNVQLPGRLLAVEILLVLLLRQKSNASQLLAQADEILTTLEANEMKHRATDYALHMFAAARANLDQIASQTRVGGKPRR